jgi:2-polyprenyl-6-methoxyphenol hydroxylase-like FAD-dependent oxidoreductase
MIDRRVLISGAGVAGPALAYRLSRFGSNPTVVERAPVLRDGGYKVDVRGTATAVLERMGLLTEADRASADVRDVWFDVWFVDGSGRPIATPDADFLMGRRGDDVELMRGDLSRLLYQATRHHAEYLFDDSICAISQDDDSVRVTFEHGHPRTFGPLVGTDGLHSNVGALTFGDESAFIRHLGSYVAIFTIPNHRGVSGRHPG